MILVATAGQVGGEAAGLLAARGEPVRVLVRDPAKAPALERAGIEVALGDLSASGEADYVTTDVPAVLGRPARSFEQFATDYATSFTA